MRDEKTIPIKKLNTYVCANGSCFLMTSQSKSLPLFYTVNSFSCKEKSQVTFAPKDQSQIGISNIFLIGSDFATVMYIV